MTIEEKMRNALVAYGAMAPDWKIKINSIERSCTGSDWVTVTCEIIKKRCRKPFIVWQLQVNTAREITDFEKSKFYYL